MVKKLEHDNFRLVDFTVLSHTDLKMVFTWRNHPTIRMRMVNNKEISEKQHNKFIKSLKNSVTKHYWMVLKNKAKIGAVYLTKKPDNPPELGMYIAPGKQGQGLGTWTMENFLSFLFSELKLTIVRLVVLDNNLAAISLYKKLGFKEKHTKLSDKRNLIVMELEK